MEKISPKAIKVWRISEAIVAAVALLLALGAFILSLFVWDWLPWWISLIIFGFFLYICIFQVWLFPALKYKHYRYEVLEDEIKIHSGIWIKRRLSVPLFRVQDRKSTRLNSSHVSTSYAVFCLKKKKK